MPFKDQERRRQANAEAQRRRRARLRHPDGVTPVGPTLPSAVRLAAVVDALSVLEEQVNAVRAAEIPVADRARCIGYLIGIGLRAIEASKLEERIGAIEERLNAAIKAASQEAG